MTAASQERLKLLLVDDCVPLRDLYELMLKRVFDVTTATEGGDGLQLAAEIHPDAIVLDVLMPGLDGWQTCRCLKSDPATASIPVILLTGADDGDLPRRARDVGASAVLTKPCRAETLKQTILDSIGVH